MSPDWPKDKQFNKFIVAQIEDKPKKTYAYTTVHADNNFLFELPEDAIFIKLEKKMGVTPIIFYLTEVDPNMPEELPEESKEEE